MSSIYDFIYGSGAGAGEEENSGDKKRSRSNPDDIYEYDPVERFYDTPPSASASSQKQAPTGEAKSSRPQRRGMGQSLQEADPFLATSLLQQPSQTSQPESDFSLSDAGSKSDGEDRPSSSVALHFEGGGDDDVWGDSSSHNRRGSILTLTPEQVKRRRKKRERERKRRRLRYEKRWDFTNEVDYGGAVRTMMRSLMNVDSALYKKKAEAEAERSASSDYSFGNESLDGEDGDKGGVLGSLLRRMSQEGTWPNPKTEENNYDRASSASNLDHVREGYAYPMHSGAGNKDALEYSYTRDASCKYGSAAPIAACHQHLHARSHSVLRFFQNKRIVESGLVEPFHYFPIMSRHGILGGRKSVESMRMHVSSAPSTSYLSPRTGKYAQTAKENSGLNSVQKKLRVKTISGSAAPHADVLHLGQLRKLAARQIAGGGGGSEPSSKYTLFRIIAALHNNAARKSRRKHGYGQNRRDRIILQYGREVEANRKLWQEVRKGIVIQMKQLLKSGDGESRQKVHDLSEDIVDIMDELISDEPSWMCGPNALWGHDSMTNRAARVRGAVLKLFRNPGGKSESQLDDGDEVDENPPRRSKRVHFVEKKESDLPIASSPPPSEIHASSNSSRNTSPVPPSALKNNSEFSALEEPDSDGDGTIDTFKFFQRASRLDPNIALISATALVTELCSSRARKAHKHKQNYTSDKHLHEAGIEDEEAELKQLLLTYLDLVLDSNTVFNQFKHIPNPILADAAMMRQSFIANDQSPCFSTLGAITSISENGKICHQVHSEDGINTSASAYDLVRTGRILKADGRLPIKSYPELHLSTAIASVASILPESAAEILSRPCLFDDPMHRTPFDLVRCTLEYMERRGQICHGEGGALRGSLSDHSTVQATLLASELQTSADLSSECAEAHPDNIDYIAWKLAFLAGAVCITSGITIGTGARAAASDYYDNRGSDRKRTRTSDHAEIRLSAAQSLRTLITLSKGAKSACTKDRCHLAISSFLEWSEAVCLLLRWGKNNSLSFRQIRQIHAHHTFKWSEVDRTEVALMCLHELFVKGEISIDPILSILAARLEQDPDNNTRWAQLASILGSKAIVQSNRDRPGWWGNGRSQWWEKQFFYSLQVEASDKCAKMFCTFSNEDGEPKPSLSSGSVEEGENFSKGRIDDEFDANFQWLASSVEESELGYSSEESSSDDDERDDPVDMTKTLKTYNHLMPKHVSDCFELDNSLNVLQTDSILSSLGEDAMILCSKCVVALHLYGKGRHPFISSAVIAISEGIAERTKESPNDESATALAWLVGRDIPVGTILSDVLKKASSSAGKISKVPYEYTPLEF